MPKQIAFFILVIMFLLLAILASWQVRDQVTTANAQQQAVLVEPQNAPVHVAETKEVKSPLAILILDKSGSMKQNDPSKLQPLAARLFAEVFAKVVRDDTSAATRQAIHLALIPFDSHTHTVTWSGSMKSMFGAGDPFLPLYGSTPAPDAALQRAGPVIDQVLVPGGGTDIKAACVEAVSLATVYRQKHGLDAEVYFILMSDFEVEGMEIESLSADLRGFSQAGHASVQVVHINQSKGSDVETMVPGFLKALDLQPLPVDLLGGAPVEGYQRALPFVVKFQTAPAQPPVLITDQGQTIPMQGHDRYFYAVVDMTSPAYKNAGKLRLADPTLPVETATLYVRKEWTLMVDARLVRRAVGSAGPNIELRPAGGRRNLPLKVEVPIESPNSDEKIPAVELKYDESKKAYVGKLPAFSIFHSKKPTEPYRLRFVPPGLPAESAIVETFLVESEFDWALREAGGAENKSGINNLPVLPGR